MLKKAVIAISLFLGLMSGNSFAGPYEDIYYSYLTDDTNCVWTCYLYHPNHSDGYVKGACADTEIGARGELDYACSGNNCGTDGACVSITGVQHVIY